IYSLCPFDGRLAHFRTQFRCDKWRRCFFYQFLMATLYGTVTLREVTNLAILVTDHLYFNMTGIFYEFLQIDSIVTKCRSSFLTARVPRGLKFVIIPHDTHSTSAAAGSRFYNDRLTNLLGQFNT